MSTYINCTRSNINGILESRLGTIPPSANNNNNAINNNNNNSDQSRPSTTLPSVVTPARHVNNTSSSIPAPPSTSSPPKKYNKQTTMEECRDYAYTKTHISNRSTQNFLPTPSAARRAPNDTTIGGSGGHFSDGSKD